MQKLLTVINRWCALLSGAVLLICLVSVLFAVAMRYLFNIAITWAFDVTSYGLLFVAFLATSRTLETGGHIRVDFLSSRLGARAQLAVEVGVQVLSLVFFVLLLWATATRTWQSVTEEWVSPSIYEIPLRYVYWIMPAGVVLMLLQGLVRLGEAILRWRAGVQVDPTPVDSRH